MPKTKQVNLGATAQGMQPNQGGVSKAAPYYRMAKAKERRAIKSGQVIYRIIKELAARAANRLLVKLGLLSSYDSHVVDFKYTMSLIETHKRAYNRFLGTSMTLDKLKAVRNARNSSDHDDLSALAHNESGNFTVLEEFCSSLGDNSAATEVQRQWSHVQNGNFHVCLAFHFRFTVFYDNHVATCLCLIVYAVITIYLADSLYELRLQRYPHVLVPPPMDAYKNLLFFQTEQLKDVDYFGPGGARRRDKELLQECIDARLANRHSGHHATFAGWLNQLEDITRMLHVMGFGLRARAVETISQILITARRNGTLVTSSQFPSLFQ